MSAASLAAGRCPEPDTAQRSGEGHQGWQPPHDAPPVEPHSRCRRSRHPRCRPRGPSGPVRELRLGVTSGRRTASAPCLRPLPRWQADRTAGAPGAEERKRRGSTPTPARPRPCHLRPVRHCADQAVTMTTAPDIARRHDERRDRLKNQCSATPPGQPDRPPGGKAEERALRPGTRPGRDGPAPRGDHHPARRRARKEHLGRLRRIRAEVRDHGPGEQVRAVQGPVEPSPSFPLKRSRP